MTIVKIDQLLSPESIDSFASNHLGKLPLIIQCKGESYPGLPNIETVVDRIQGDPIVKADIQIIGKPTRETGSRITKTVDFWTYFGNGQTFRIKNASNHWPQINTLCKILTSGMSNLVMNPCQKAAIVLFLSPPMSKALVPHNDPDDIFVFQIEGIKTWYFYGNAPMPYPLDRQQEFEERYRFDVSEGDLIYLPKGFVHNAETTSETSLHLSIGVKSTS